MLHEKMDCMAVRQFLSRVFYFSASKKLTLHMGSATEVFPEERRQMPNAQTPAGGAWSKVRDGTCQEEVGHERRDNKTESGRGGGRRRAMERLEIRRAQSKVATAETT